MDPLEHRPGRRIAPGAKAGGTELTFGLRTVAVSQ
jgi:hypothetical protein